MIKKVRIVDCDDDRKWYQKRVGEIFDALYFTDKEVYVKTNDSYNTGNFICNENYEEIADEHPTTY